MSNKELYSLYDPQGSPDSRCSEQKTSRFGRILPCPLNTNRNGSIVNLIVPVVRA